MKKLFLINIIVIFFILLCGCSYTQKKNTKSSDFLSTKIEYIEIELCGIEWENIEFEIDSHEIALPENINSIKTKEDAIFVGKHIITEYHKNNMWKDLSLLTIVHSKKDDVWRFDYSIDQRSTDSNNFIDGSVIYVAIDGKNCKLIKAWIEE